MTASTVGPSDFALAENDRIPPIPTNAGETIKVAFGLILLKNSVFAAVDEIFRLRDLSSDN